MPKKINILIVEDEAFIGMHMKMTFEQYGYAITLCASGEKAIDYAVKYSPDVIIMDIHLASALNGIDAALEINRHISTKYIFTTGYNDNDFIEELSQFAPLAILSKPVNFEMTYTLIDQYFNTKTQ